MLQVNGSVFTYDYTDKQVLNTVQDPVFGTLRKLTNIPESSVDFVMDSYTLVNVLAGIASADDRSARYYPEAGYPGHTAARYCPRSPSADPALSQIKPGQIVQHLPGVAKVFTPAERCRGNNHPVNSRRTGSLQPIEIVLESNHLTPRHL
jgi:hypothetical protein